MANDPQPLRRRLSHFAKGDLPELNRMVDLLNLLLQEPPLGPHWYGYAVAQSASFSDTMRVDTEVYNGDSDLYSLASNALTVRKPGWYLVRAQSGIECFTGPVAYSTSLQVDTGGGFVNIPGALITEDLDVLISGSVFGSFSMAIIHQLTNTTSKYRVRGTKIIGVGDAQFDGGTGRLMVHRVSPR